MRIRFFSSFCDSDNCKTVYERLCQTDLLDFYGEGSGKDTIITVGEDYTHAVIINTAMPQSLNVPKERVIGLAFEPPQFLNLTPEFIKYAEKNIGVYFIGIPGLPAPFVSHFGFMWHCGPASAAAAAAVPKTRLMSIMVSDKGHAPGHKLRHELVQRILRTKLPIDIYGRGCKYYNIKDDRLKGEFSEVEPYTGYKYHVAIENYQTESYFSEKVMNPLLCGVIPIYSGCATIDKYFPNSIIQLGGSVDTAFKVLVEICLKGGANYEIDIDKVKNTINLVKFLKDWSPTKRLV
jgi:hypothetical protein